MSPMIARLPRRTVLRLVAFAGAAALAACGKVGSPVPPPDHDPKSPRFYPADRRTGAPTPPPDTLPAPQTAPPGAIVPGGLPADPFFTPSTR
jgi:hypothetical protein